MTAGGSWTLPRFSCHGLHAVCLASALAAVPFAMGCGFTGSATSPQPLLGADGTRPANDGALGGLADTVDAFTTNDILNAGDDATALDESTRLSDSASIDETPAADMSESLDAEAPSDAAGTDGVAADVAAQDGGIDPGPANDAGNEAEAGALSATETLLLAKRGEECVRCATAHHCFDDGTQDSGRTCDDFDGQVALGGPDFGALRKDLCLNTLACALNTDCYATGIPTCICGPEALFTCVTVGPVLDAGPTCVVSEQAGLETVLPRVAIAHVTDPSLGGGRANAVVDCMTRALCQTCF